MKRPNVVFVFSDQHRLCSTGYGGDPAVRTPVMDRLAREGCNFTLAVSGHPVCCAYRASLLTGQYPQTHGVILNDAPLNTAALCLGEAFAQAGYDTAYIGKWHVDGHGRGARIPPARRRGFHYWKALECSHDYWASPYYSQEAQTPSQWAGYDAFAQTQDAIEYLAGREKDRPVLLLLSWGPPHNPYHTAPEAYRALYAPDVGALRPNVPFDMAQAAARDIAGYNAHITALDHSLGRLLAALEDMGMGDNTLFVYTSDHGDMLGSQGVMGKQKPWDESIRVPFLLLDPRAKGPRRVETPFAAPDIMPTLLELCGIPIPPTVEGVSLAAAVREGREPDIPAALIQCIHPFGGWHKFAGGREYRGVRTRRYTYARGLEGPWLLYDNQEDPYQLVNLLEGEPNPAPLKELEDMLFELLRRRGDPFLPGRAYLERWGYRPNFLGTLPF